MLGREHVLYAVNEKFFQGSVVGAFTKLWPMHEMCRLRSFDSRVNFRGAHCQLFCHLSKGRPFFFIFQELEGHHHVLRFENHI